MPAGVPALQTDEVRATPLRSGFNKSPRGFPTWQFGAPHRFNFPAMLPNRSYAFCYTMAGGRMCVRRRERETADYV